MGSSPKTKSDYQAAIARKQGEIERIKAILPEIKRKEKEAIKKYGSINFSHGSSWQLGQIASLKAEIARLKAEMKNAPKG
jgi:uncharacterized small protein (DUF1192 family)